MKNKLFKNLIIVCVVIYSTFLFSCNNLNQNVSVSQNSNVNVPHLDNVNIYEYKAFGNIDMDISIEEFNKLGFEYGDSVNVMISNGYEALDIPYFDGYYAKTGDLALVSYPTHDNVHLCIVNGDRIWDIAKVTDKDTISVILNEKGKYKKVQELLKIKYSNDREEYVSDIAFANFRNVKMGNIKEKMLYRGASPIDNLNFRAKYADKLIAENGIKYDINLSDSSRSVHEHLNKEDCESPYFDSLYQNNKVITLSMDMNFRSKKFGEKVVEALIAMSKNDGPYYIHCVEGKDRTGVFCAIIEGLAGATYEEIVDDYMKTYDNYYGINEKTDKLRYDTIKNQYIDYMLRFYADYGENGNKDIELKDLEWTNIMGRYLTDNGMTIEDLNNLYDKLFVD